KTEHGVVMIDGFEYLITTQGFDRFLSFLQLNTSRFAQKEAIMIAPLLREALDSRSEMLIRREMTLYKPV
ncbi:MAG: DUF835 domain-containing protein, partial [Candidatus Bathyarchaeia archaeon]